MLFKPNKPLLFPYTPVSRNLPKNICFTTQNLLTYKIKTPDLSNFKLNLEFVGSLKTTVKKQRANIRSMGDIHAKDENLVLNGTEDTNPPKLVSKLHVTTKVIIINLCLQKPKRMFDNIITRVGLESDGGNSPFGKYITTAKGK
jgi:hypothetical protein